jgi:hypothetical protein
MLTYLAVQAYSEGRPGLPAVLRTEETEVQKSIRSPFMMSSGVTMPDDDSSKNGSSR